MAQSAHQIGTLDRTLDQIGDRIQLEDRFVFRRPGEVSRYLEEYPHLVPLLLNAAAIVPRYFGADASLALEVFEDPEGGVDERELFAIVQTRLDPQEALKRLYRLQDEWWLAASPEGPGAVVIDVELV